ncbi:hypothetical protein [Nannocystis radixulma]|uniref:P/Homo B domain-containing protein n=1 Tax=Nannocystis radixulma TaxID=2995305 RepID=A0ABT5BQU2_9BACT|nr:hypothetical protein [Nannocystis radixulma]MDC0675773.1 hypothetical protein [Nannocystis radixulma]
MLPTACELFGGPDAVAAFVAQFTDILYDDTRINVYFLNEGFVPPKFSLCLTNYLAVALSCDGVEYTCGGMQTVHGGMRISAADVADFQEDFVAALDAFAPGGLPEGVTSALLGAVDAVGQAIVEDPNNDATIYQRIGRNPTLLGFAADLNARIAAHPALSSFWADVMAGDKLAACYARFVGADEEVAGPMRYGEELAPLPKCQHLGDAHSDVTGINDAAIAVEDFTTYMIEVVDQVALSFAGESQADRDVLVEVFADQCEAVVTPANDCPSAHEVVDVTIDNPAGWFIPAHDPMDPPMMPGLCRTFNVAASEYDFVGEVWIDDFSLTHTWGGDLVITLTNPEGDIVLHLLKRPGHPLVPTGYGPVFAQDWPVSFLDAGDTNAQQLGKNYMPGDIVCKKYGDCKLYPPPDIMEPAMMFSAFAGVQASGDWKLCIEDHAIDGNTGYLYGATLHLDKVKHSL